MFSIYGTGGRVFHGSMEELRRVGATSGLARSRRIVRVGQDSVDHADGVRYADSLAAAPVSAPTDIAHRVALATYEDVRKQDTPRQPLTKVQSIMSTQVVTIPGHFTVEQAWGVLGENGIGQAPVVSDAAVLVGLVARGELLRADRLPKSDAHPLVWRAWLAQPVTDVMWSPVPSVTADTDIRRVARVLLDTGLPGLPVVKDDGRVQGFVSRSDILRAVVADPPLDLWS